MVTTDKVCIGYDDQPVVSDFSHCFTPGKIHTIIGPNGSGKSTVFKAISRLLRHKTGSIHVSNYPIEHYHPKNLAKQLAVLSQTNHAPSDFTVRDLIRFGRTPHKRLFEALTLEDEKIVDWAIEMTHLKSLEHRRVSCLSGGERQRAWIAMNLTQQPEILLLDEPTTYLDIQHQFEVMELIKSLNKNLKMTIVMILHDLNQASIYSDEILVLKDGKVVCTGSPHEVMKPELIKSVYNVSVHIGSHFSGKPMVIPVGI
jgi:iron complex transport system ATP-binding protein